MPRRALALALVATTILAISTTHLIAAETLNVKSGLWETTSTTEATGMPPIPPEVAARMTPQQQVMVQESMRRALAKNGKPRTQQQCITQEEINSAFGNLAPNSGCKTSVVTSTAKVQETQLACTGSTKATGTLHIEASSPENVTGSSQMTVGEGQNVMVVKTQFTAHWLGSDCGSVSPAGSGAQ
jgi:hypothetical protein